MFGASSELASVMEFGFNVAVRFATEFTVVATNLYLLLIVYTVTHNKHLPVHDRSRSSVTAGGTSTLSTFNRNTIHVLIEYTQELTICSTTETSSDISALTTSKPNLDTTRQGKLSSYQHNSSLLY